jgi:hypothetical protein
LIGIPKKRGGPERYGLEAMGLLDDAIREHLELKRLGGADPSEVIRQEQEALGPALRGDGATHGEHEGASEERSAARQDQVPDRVEDHPDKDLPYRGQETVELDMQAILGVESSDHAPHAKPVAQSPMRSSGPSRVSASGGRITGAFSGRGLPDESEADFGRSRREGSPIGRHQILDARGPQSGDAGIQESPAQHA